MNYAMDLLKNSVYELQKSRDALCNMADTIKELKETDNEDIRKEVLKDFESDKHSIGDKIDSLCYAIDYLSKASLPVNARSDIEESVWVKVCAFKSIKHADQFTEELAAIVGRSNVMKCGFGNGIQYIIFVSAKAINDYHDKVFEITALYGQE